MMSKTVSSQASKRSVESRSKCRHGGEVQLKLYARPSHVTAGSRRAKDADLGNIHFGNGR